MRIYIYRRYLACLAIKGVIASTIYDLLEASLYTLDVFINLFNRHPSLFFLLCRDHLLFSLTKWLPSLNLLPYIMLACLNCIQIGRLSWPNNPSNIKDIKHLLGILRLVSRSIIYNNFNLCFIMASAPMLVFLLLQFIDLGLKQWLYIFVYDLELVNTPATTITTLCFVIFNIGLEFCTSSLSIALCSYLCLFLLVFI
jgi:hypothetical protein